MKYKQKELPKEITQEQYDNLSIKDMYEPIVESVRWRAEYGKLYWYIDDCGCVSRRTDTRGYADDFCYATGNYYQTEELVEAAKEHQLLEREWKDIVLRVNEGWVADWENETQYKTFIYFDHSSRKFKYPWSTVSQTAGTDHFESVKIAREALKLFGEDKYKKLFGI